MTSPRGKGQLGAGATCDPWRLAACIAPRHCGTPHPQYGGAKKLGGLSAVTGPEAALCMSSRSAPDTCRALQWVPCVMPPLGHWPPFERVKQCRTPGLMRWSVARSLDLGLDTCAALGCDRECVAAPSSPGLCRAPSMKALCWALGWAADKDPFPSQSYSVPPVCRHTTVNK